LRKIDLDEMNEMSCSTVKTKKPFLKWVGGKTQIIDTVINKFPLEMENYHELFLGGGSVLLAVLSKQKEQKIKIKQKVYAYDINKPLINVYMNIQKNKDELFKYITKYMNEYDSIDGDIVNRKPLTIDEGKTSKESYYYWIRQLYNKIDKECVECSALFMILNKTCFRGMYREGPNGYNVPFGHYKTTPTIITQSELGEISELIADVDFVHCDFRESILKVKTGDFVYLDPPYVPEKDKKSFVGYNVDGFDLKTHQSLFSEVLKFSEKNIHFLLSNSKVELVVDTFKDFFCEDIRARRAINSKNPGATTTELLVCNYT